LKKLHEHEPNLNRSNPVLPFPVAVKNVRNEYVQLFRGHYTSGPVYDWVQARARDIFAAYNNGDVATVLAAVQNYTVAALNVYGQTNGVRGPQSPVILNPFFNDARLDSQAGDECGYSTQNSFKNTLLHEARHAYQFAQAALVGNDLDGDYLVNAISIAPTTIFLDTTVSRAVCNVSNLLNPVSEQRSYHGDSRADSYGAPDYAQAALEQDAVVFASIYAP